MALTGKSNEEKIWNYLTGKGLTPHGTAGLMGNLYAESGLKFGILEVLCRKRLKENGKGDWTDEAYTAAVDDGTISREEFLHPLPGKQYGYGIAQWTTPGRKAGLYDLAKKRGVSIADPETQLEYLMQELYSSYQSVYNVLATAMSVRAASDIVLTKFECPADQSGAVKQKRAGYGQTYYDRYAGGGAGSGETPEEAPQKGGTSTMTENELRQKVVGIAKKYLGCRESDGSHRKIIDLYNSHKPLARGYAVKYTDAWCSTFASAVAIEAGLTDIIPTECGCGEHIKLFQRLGSWQESDAYTPKPGDYIFYDWDDSGAGDNKGNADHVGIVEKVSGSTITVIEGNKGNAVDRRTLAVNGRYIRGYGVPKYSSKATGSSSGSGGAKPSAPQTGGKKSLDEIAKEVIAGSWGNGDDRKKKLNAAGYDYNAVQKRVNELLAGKTSARTYTVKKGDSLWAIAAKMLGDGTRYKEIKSLNGLKSDTIYAGQVLRLP